MTPVAAPLPVAAPAPLREPTARPGVDEPSKPVPGSRTAAGGRNARRGAAAGRAARRRKRLWLAAVAAVIVVAAVAAAGYAYLTRSPGRTHVLVIPARLGAFVRKSQLEQQMHVQALQRQIIAKSGGQASHVVSAVYEDGTGTGKGQPQIILFIGGNLTNVSPGGFVSSFTAQFGHAHPARPGPLGGSTSCVTSARSGAPNQVALCTWADSDTFGVVASPTMSLTQLSIELRAIRPVVEHTAR